MVGPILFPTNFSQAANEAFPAALHLASLFGVELITVHAYIEPSIPHGYMTRTLQEIAEAEAFEEFEYYREQLVPLHDIAAAHAMEHVPIRHALCPGSDILQQILSVAKREKAGLIVMGTTGYEGLSELFSGTLASEVLENAACPVLVIPEKVVFQSDPRRIAYALDIEAQGADEAPWLQNFAAHLGAKIVYLNLPSVGLSEFSAWADSRGLSHSDFAFCDCWEDEAGLAGFLESQGVDLLALTTHKTSFFAEFFRPNFGKRLARNLAFPLLGIPPGQS
jgi:nucleotide-binding universal stress UspA family protein